MTWSTSRALDIGVWTYKFPLLMQSTLILLIRLRDLQEQLPGKDTSIMPIVPEKDIAHVFRPLNVTHYSLCILQAMNSFKHVIYKTSFRSSVIPTSERISKEDARISCIKRPEILAKTSPN